MILFDTRFMVSIQGNKRNEESSYSLKLNKFHCKSTEGKRTWGLTKGGGVGFMVYLGVGVMVYPSF